MPFQTEENKTTNQPERTMNDFNKPLDGKNQLKEMMNNTTNAAKRPSGLRACADGLDVNPDKDFAQKCMRYAADRMDQLERELTAARAELVTAYEEMDAIRIGTRLIDSDLKAVTEQRDRLAEAVNAATILIAAKGRHNTMLAYNGLRDALQSLP
jgi:hypothetical protein